MDAVTFGWIGGIGGCVIGVAGGIFGTWCSMRNAKTPAEKSLIVRYSVACWLLVCLFLAAVFFTPQPYNWLWWIPYPIILAYGINRLNREQKLMRILSGEAIGS